MKTLSDRKMKHMIRNGYFETVYSQKDVKEFIKELKDDVWNSKGQWRKRQVLEIIDKLAGDKLIKENKK